MISLKFHKFLWFLCFELVIALPQSPPIHHGDCDNSGSCHFTGIHLTENQPNFILKVDIPNEQVTSVSLQKNHIPLLTSDICDTFPYIRVLVVDRSKISKIDKNALINCRYLTVLDLNQNDLVELDSSIFAGNKELKTLILYDNKMRELNTAIFSFTPFLETLVLGKNLLTEFPVERIAGLKELTSVNLQENLFEDLDDDTMIERFSKLKQVSLCPNDEIPRDRLMEIIENFSSRGVKVNDC